MTRHGSLAATQLVTTRKDFSTAFSPSKTRFKVGVLYVEKIKIYSITIRDNN